LILEKREQLEVIVNSDANGAEKLKSYIKLIIMSIKKHPEIIQISLREMANFGVDIEGGDSENQINQEFTYLSKILQELDLKVKYKNLDPAMIKSIIFGTINTYYSMQMSNIKLTHGQEFHKNSDEILDFISDTVSNILLDSLIRR
jgi:hypothetical protein